LLLFSYFEKAIKSKIYHTLLSIVAALLLLATACNRPVIVQEKDESIEETFENITPLLRTYPDSAVLLLNTLYDEHSNRLTNRQRQRFYEQQAIAQFTMQNFEQAKLWYSKRYKCLMRQIPQSNNKPPLWQIWVRFCKQWAI
jgi:hypothetical protein